MVDQDAKKGSGGEMVRLYTRQNDKTLYQLERDGRIINQRVYVELHFGDIAPLFMESYDWFTEEAARRVEKPADVHAPIWCSISRENCLKPIEGTVYMFWKCRRRRSSISMKEVGLCAEPDLPPQR